MVKIKTLAIIQARVSSTRFPCKVLKKIEGKTLIELMVERVKIAKKIDFIALATSIDSSDSIIENICNKIDLPCYRGSLNNVLDRFYQVALNYKSEYIVRLTGDCPLIDSSIIDKAVCLISGTDLDYVSNTLIPTYPDGMDVEVFRFSALAKAHREARLASEREHVTPYIWKNSTIKGGTLFKSASLENEVDYSGFRLTVDYPEDFEVVRNLVTNLGTNKNWIDYVNYLKKHSELEENNSKYLRNEGYFKSVNNDHI